MDWEPGDLYRESWVQRLCAVKSASAGPLEVSNLAFRLPKEGTTRTYLVLLPEGAPHPEAAYKNSILSF